MRCSARKASCGLPGEGRPEAHQPVAVRGPSRRGCRRPAPRPRRAGRGAVGRQRGLARPDRDARGWGPGRPRAATATVATSVALAVPHLDRGRSATRAPRATRARRDAPRGGSAPSGENSAAGVDRGRAQRLPLAGLPGRRRPARRSRSRRRARRRGPSRAGCGTRRWSVRRRPCPPGSPAPPGRRAAPAARPARGTRRTRRRFWSGSQAAAVPRSGLTFTSILCQVAGARSPPTGPCGRRAGP